MNNAGMTDGGCPIVRLDQLLVCPLGRARLLTLGDWPGGQCLLYKSDLQTLFWEEMLGTWLAQDTFK